jgi:phage head maturation protease
MTTHAKADDTKPVVKSITSFEIKDADKGEVRAVIATLGVIDRDGDIIRKGAIPDGAKVAVSSYGHDAVWGNRPVGKGTLSTQGNKVLFDGRLFLNTTDGRDTFEVLKEMGADQEWSFGFRIIGYEVPTEEEKKQGAYRVLTKLDAFEVSPVLVGAGIGTQTLAVKQSDGDAGDHHCRRRQSRSRTSPWSIRLL